MFMRLYFRIMFFTSHECLCSFIINYLSYLVFLSCSSYVPKLKGPGSMRWHHLSISSRRESLNFLQQPFGFNRGRVSKPPGNTMNSTILVPWIWFRDILRVGFCHGCDFKQNADIGPDLPPTHRTKTQLFCFEGMRSHHIEMACPIASAAWCTPQYGWSGRVFVFKLHR